MSIQDLLRVYSWHAERSSEMIENRFEARSLCLVSDEPARVVVLLAP